MVKSGQLWWTVKKKTLDRRQIENTRPNTIEQFDVDVARVNDDCISFLQSATISCRFAITDCAFGDNKRLRAEAKTEIGGAEKCCPEQYDFSASMLVLLKMMMTMIVIGTTTVLRKIHSI